MINVSSAWERALYNDNRNYIEQIAITLENNTVLNLTNEHIWGGAKFDDAVSNDSNFEIGSAIVNKLMFNINNIYEDFSEYDFTNAKVVAKLGLVTDEGTEIIKKGTYTVNTATYNGSLINIECYDNMSKFEKQYSESTLVYPATLDTIVRGACTDCGVQLQTLNFPHKTYVIQERPSDDNCTYREIISWCAQVAGCFARCNPDGKLEIKWYDQEAIGITTGNLDGGTFDDGSPSYISGDTADGGTFNPWNTGYVYDSGTFLDEKRVHYINSLYSKNISVDDVVITGIRILVDSDGNNPIEPVIVGTSGYVIEISGNKLITATNANEIATWLGTQLIGFRFRQAQVSHGSDPSIEAGDVAFLTDGNARTYPIVISHTVFAVGEAQSTVSAAQTPARNSAQRFTAETRNYVELRKAIKNERTAREQAEEDIAQAVANANGLYETTIVNEVTGASTYYLHNKRLLSDSAIRIMISDVGITVTADSGQHWYGLTASGDMITHLLSATGINADWINTGQLVIEDAQHNETFFADADSGVVRIAPTQFTLTPANQQYIQNTANSAASGAVSAFENGDFATFVTSTNNKLDVKITTFYQASSPTASATGDLWIDTDDGNKLYRWDGSSWGTVQDEAIQTALTNAQSAKTTADSKIITFAQASQPTATDIGDLWIDTDDNNKLYRWDGSTWSPMTDTSGLQSWITGTYTSDITDLQSQIDEKIETWRQATDPSLAWTDTATKDKHVKDLWYCTSTTDVIPSWLLPYVGKESGMTSLLSQRADDTWFSITNDANFSIDGATSTNIYIDSNSTIAFADSQPSTSGRNQAYNLNICRRDGQAVSIKHQTITSGSNKAVKIKFSGYTAYSQTDQTSEYANEYEVFFTNSNEVYINVLKQPTNTSYLGDTSIKDNSATVTFSLSAGAHVSIKKVSDAWVATVDKYTNNTSWIYTKTGNVYSWEKLDSGIPSELLDEIDGKAQIFTTSSTPTDASEGDLWFKSVSDPIKTYVNGQWVEYNKYTDDSTANANLVTAKSYSDTNLASAKSYADTKVSTYDTNLDQQAVFNKLTNNGQTQGIFLENNRIYINMTYASTGTLVVGGSSSNTDGEIEVKNSYGSRIGRIDKTGMYFGNIISNLNNPYFRLYDNGVLESRFGSSSYYAKMGSTYGFEIQGNGINAKLYASSWTYKQNDTVDPGAEVPDYSESVDIDTRPGFYGYNTALKVTDSSYSSRGTYTAIGKNYIELAYSSKEWDVSDSSSYPTIAQLRSTSSHQVLTLAYRYGDFTSEKSLVLDETGFRRIINNGNEYTPYTGTFTISGTTYYVRGGIVCKKTSL